MIYGAYIGILIIACGVMRAWLSWTATILIGAGVTLIILAMWAYRSQIVRVISPATPAPPASPPPAAPNPTPPAPTPAPVAASKSYRWPWWLVVIAVIALLAWWGHKTHISTPPRVSTLSMEMRQRFSVTLDPLTFNKQKSKGVRVETDRGFMTIIVKPGGRLVYNFNLLETPMRSGFASIDYQLREILPQYAGYQINNVRHKEEYLFGSGSTRLGPELREFQGGINELAFFSNGELRINGDEKIVVYQR